MASNLARLKQLPAPTQLSDLDGWTAQDMEGWLGLAGRSLAEGERQIGEVRVSVGLVLYRLRVEVGDGAYGEACSRIAGAAGVTVRTLTNWRTAAEQNFQLPPPSERTVARRQRAVREKQTKESLPKSSAGQGDTQVPEVQPAPTKESGSSPRADGTAASRGAQPPDPPPLPQPQTQADYRRLVALTVDAGSDVLAKSAPAAQIEKSSRTMLEALEKEASDALTKVVLDWVRSVPATKLLEHVFNERKEDVLAIDGAKAKPLAQRMRKWADLMDPPEAKPEPKSKSSSGFRGLTPKDVTPNFKKGAK